MPGQTEWVFVGPRAVLNDRGGKAVRRYYGPPPTWEANDGAKLTGTQVAVAPSGPTSLPYQLVKANPAMGNGAFREFVPNEGCAKGRYGTLTPLASNSTGLPLEADFAYRMRPVPLWAATCFRNTDHTCAPTKSSALSQIARGVRAAEQ